MVEDRIEVGEVRAHPRTALGVEPGGLRRIDVHAADDDVGVGLEHGVGEPAAGREVVGMPNEVAEVLRPRHRMRPAKPSNPGVRRMWSTPAVQAA